MHSSILTENDAVDRHINLQYYTIQYILLKKTKLFIVEAYSVDLTDF